MSWGSKLIVDACALMDFIDANTSVLATYAARINSVHVTPDVIVQVFHVQAYDLERSSLTVIEPTLEQHIEAAEPGVGLWYGARTSLTQ